MKFPRPRPVLKPSPNTGRYAGKCPACGHEETAHTKRGVERKMRKSCRGCPTAEIVVFDLKHPDRYPRRFTL